MITTSCHNTKILARCQSLPNCLLQPPWRLSQWDSSYTSLSQKHFLQDVQTSFIRQSFLRTIPTNQHLLGIDLCSAPPTPFNLWYQLSTLCCEDITCVANPAIAPHQALSVLHLGTNFSIVQHQFLMKLWIGVWSYHARNKLEVPQNRTATWLSFSRAKALNGNPENQQAWSPPGNYCKTIWQLLDCSTT